MLQVQTGGAGGDGLDGGDSGAGGDGMGDEGDGGDIDGGEVEMGQQGGKRGLDPGILRVKGGLAYSCPISLLIIIFAGINNQCKENK